MKLAIKSLEHDQVFRRQNLIQELIKFRERKLENCQLSTCFAFHLSGNFTYWSKFVSYVPMSLIVHKESFVASNNFDPFFGLGKFQSSEVNSFHSV